MPLIATDLDGTLLGPDRSISAANLAALHALGERGVVRVVATGRSGYSAHQVLPASTPIDYLVVSSGAGIIRWSDGAYLHTQGLRGDQTVAAVQAFVALEVDFMVHDPIPDNHRFRFRRAQGCVDFERRVAHYRTFATEHAPPDSWANEACQLVAVHDADRDDVLPQIETRLSDLTVVRTTSPLDHGSVWIEVFPATVSKSQACAWIAERHGLTSADVAAVGNDTNDLDMLHWAGRSFAVGNAHPSLLAAFEPVADYAADGFADAVDRADLLSDP